MAAFEEFLLYKKRIPVRGAIMLNHDMDSVVLVKGWKKGANWSFPRGKINREEDDLVCAIREVYEETGYDLQAAGLVPENREVKHITLPIRDQDMRLYVFRDVPMDTYFEPRTRKEISKIQWWRISDLPGFRRKGQQNPETSAGANKFYMVASFLRDLRKWIIEQKKLDTRRTTSNQYLSAVSHEEILTEEDQGAESMHEQNFPISPISALDTLEGATAALRSLLKLQPPTQGLQTGAVNSPVPRDSGSELLALLQGKPQTSNQDTQPRMQPQTPLDHTISQAPQPETPHYQQHRPPHFLSLPPPPTFPIQQASSTFSYQEPSQASHNYHNNSFRVDQQSTTQASRAQSLPHHQSQHLVHPQPLPPHVQRAVFNGGPVHAPMVPQPIQSYAPQLSSTISVAAPNPQFHGIHAPMVPPFPAQSPPKLTSHKLALLNAFKIQDEGNGDNGASSNLPLRRYVQDLASPQELPAETAQSVPVDLFSLFKAKDSPIKPSNPSIPPPRPISEAQKSALLGLFKSPTTPSAALSTPAATAFPISATPSAVELSAVEPHSNAGPVSTSAEKASNAGSLNRHGRDIPELNPEANLPFRAMSILTRPSHLSGLSEGHQPMNQHNGKKHVAKQDYLSQQQGNRSQQAHKLHSKLSPSKSFRPQILKRPQQDTTTETEDPKQHTFSSMPAEVPVSTQIPGAAHLPRQAPLTLPIHSSSDRRSSYSAGHKQALLSLFGKSPSSAVPFVSTSTDDVISPLQPMESATTTSTRSRVGSLAGANGISRKSSQAPISPADKTFLLNYLDGVAKEAQR